MLAPSAHTVVSPTPLLAIMGLVTITGLSSAAAGPVCSLHRTADQEIDSASNGWEYIEFGSGTEESDSNNMHSTSTNNHLVTIPSSNASWYLIWAHVQWDDTSGGQFSHAFRVNGSRVGEADRTNTSGDDWHNLGWLAYLEVNDTVALEVWESASSKPSVKDARLVVIKVNGTEDEGVRIGRSSTQSIASYIDTNVNYTSCVEGDCTNRYDSTNDRMVGAEDKCWHVLFSHHKWASSGTGERWTRFVRQPSNDETGLLRRDATSGNDYVNNLWGLNMKDNGDIEDIEVNVRQTYYSLNLGPSYVASACAEEELGYVVSLKDETDQAVANNGWETLNFDGPGCPDGECSDEPRWHSPTTNNHEIAIGVDGWYLVLGYLNWETSGSGQRQMRFEINDTTIRGKRDRNAMGNDLLTNSLVVYLEDGDTIEMHAWQSSGGSLDVQTAQFKVIKLD